MDPITNSTQGHVQTIAKESVVGMVRGIACALCAAALGWHDHDIAKLALGVIALVASPSLARTFLAPKLAGMISNASKDSAQ